MIFYLFILPFVSSLNQGSQVPLDIENFSDPICDKHSECISCSFEELRTFDVCAYSGYYQTVFCTMRNTLANSTQEISYVSSCFPAKASILSSFSWFFIISAISAIFLVYNWRILRNKKIEAQQANLENIIKA
ncbi:unnamed protein product [Blepharisma stoltei]|uniref:Uncharacterized protein n=1 Tax=Blepharisma stoltei TaxID=1481888 RepID=A0AAU9JB73_9CILI|nr:unnamed protein product [Blepharisma stoltei]